MDSKGSSRAPILTFHAIESNGDTISFPSGLFRTGIAQLAAAGFRAVPLEDLVGQSREAHGFAARTYAVTFDDGYESVYREAFPVLQEYAIPATVFVCPGPDGLTPLEGRPMLSWGQLQEMHHYGIRVGAHSLTHPDLRQLPRERAETEIAGSQARLEERLGAAVRTFAYPFGRFDTVSREIASRHYDFACTDRLGQLHRHADPFALPRIDAFYLRSRRAFPILLSPLFPAYVTARAIPRQCRRWWSGRGGG